MHCKFVSSPTAFGKYKFPQTVKYKKKQEKNKEKLKKDNILWNQSIHREQEIKQDSNLLQYKIFHRRIIKYFIFTIFLYKKKEFFK